MICSIQELGFDGISQGIEILDSKYPTLPNVGEPVIDLLGLNDSIVELATSVDLLKPLEKNPRKGDIAAIKASSAGVKPFGIDAKLASAASPCDIGFISPVVFAEPRAASACGIPKRASALAPTGNMPGTKAAAMGSKGAISLGTILSATLLATLLTLLNNFLIGIYSPDSDPMGGISITFTNTSVAL